MSASPEKIASADDQIKSQMLARNEMIDWRRRAGWIHVDVHKSCGQVDAAIARERTECQ
jgi:hypothetical protein